jgi:leucyl aminopeptidase
MININFSAKISESITNKVFFVDTTLSFSAKLNELDLKSGEFISKVLRASKNFSAKFGQIKIVSVVLANEVCNIILVGIGEPNDLNQIKVENLGGKICKVAESLKNEAIEINAIADDQACSLAFGFLLASYSFDKYKTKIDEPSKFVKQCNIIVTEEDKVKHAFENVRHLQQTIFLTRDLVSEVPNVLNTDHYTALIEKHLTGLNVKLDVLGELEMKNLGMNALLGVGQGSSCESKLVIMEYNGSDSNEPPVVLVGKGVTFDTGGISLKPADGMHEMKYDMAGSASVFGAVRALAANNAKVNVIGVVALVENMPDGNAQRPGDVLTTMSGQTVEVLNTDAEGRLILADALWYAQSKFNPKAIIDVATLTGAIVVALGNTFAGCFSNNDKLAEQIHAAGIKVNEKVWRMPMHEEYDKMIKSEVADWANIGTGRGTAGSAMGAHFWKNLSITFHGLT